MILLAPVFAAVVGGMTLLKSASREHVCTPFVVTQFIFARRLRSMLLYFVKEPPMKKL